MTAKVIALYNTPADPKAFDDYYFQRHVPLAKGLPGLLRYEVNDGPVVDIEGKPACYLAATLSFESLQAVQVALASEVGAAAAADLANFATAGVNLLIFASKEV
ncbi:MAG: EthD family reductase [Betaproteobacteria bacterium]|nr:EthD family reductase [Betaproteobacteria bacterium]